MSKFLLILIILTIFLTFLMWIGCHRIPPTLTFDTSLPRIRANGYDFHGFTIGNHENPPIILIHGGPGGDMQYLKNFMSLKDTYHLLFYDQKNTGLSPRETVQNETIDSSIEDLYQLTKIHGKGKPVILIGHSWGAMLAAGLMAKYPDSVLKAVLMEPGMMTTEAGKYFIETLKKSTSFLKMIKIIPGILKALFVKSIDGHETMDYGMTYMMNHGGGQPYQCAWEKLPQDSFTRTGYQTMNYMLRPIMKNPDLFLGKEFLALKNFTKDTLFLSSECSFIGYDFQEKFHKHLFPKNSLHWKVSATGHNMHQTKPEETIEKIRKFLKGSW